MKTIGIVMRIEKFDHAYKWFINESYINALQALHVAVFPICSDASLACASTQCDALLLPGGYDLHAYYLHENMDCHSKTYAKSMDHFDLRCIDCFIHAHKPILGICRGMQLLNVYHHGTLHQHIAEENHAKRHQHIIKSCENRFLQQLYPPTFQVNSYHHQCVDHLGDGLYASAYTMQGEIEAFENEQRTILAVQWHPEKMEDDQVLPYFLDIVCM